MHGPFSAPSRYSSAFEFPASMIHPCWTATTTPWCPGTHSGLRARRPTAYSGPQPARRGRAVPSHPHVASLPRRSRAMAYAHAHLHHTQPTATLHHCCHRSSLACHRHCRHLRATAAAVYAPPPPPSTCHRRHRLRATAAAVYVPPPPPSTCHRRRRLRAAAAAVYVPPPPPSTRLSLDGVDAHAPWRTHTRTSTTRNATCLQSRDHSSGVFCSPSLLSNICSCYPQLPTPRPVAL